MSTTPPVSLIPWLTWEKSLTHKLHSISGDTRLELLKQQWGHSDKWDKDHLKLTDNELLNREILMWAFDLPCWYARTIIEKATYIAHTDLFDRLRNESLGDLIFNGQEIKRKSLKAYSIGNQSVEYGWLKPYMHKHAELLWVRLSEFSIKNNHSFFLVEILLPGLLRYIA